MGEMNKVLYHLCRHCVSIMDGFVSPIVDCFVPLPSTVLCKLCGLSLYKTRKELKNLKEQGYVVAGRCAEHTEERTILINGYTITDKAKETEEYKKAYQEEREVCWEAFGIRI